MSDPSESIEAVRNDTRGRTTVNRTKRIQFVALSTIGFVAVLGLLILLIWPGSSSDDNPAGPGIEPQMPVSLTTFLLAIAAIVVVGGTAVLVRVEVISPRRALAAMDKRRDNLDGGTPNNTDR